MDKKKIVVFTGAGISRESGIPTFRDTDGMWSEHIADEVASMEGWKKNKEKVLNFHNEFIREYAKCKPNDAHKALAKLEETFDVAVVTQNIDCLHEQGGSTNVIHLHGNVKESKSSNNTKNTYPLIGDIKIGDKAEDGSQLRHNTILFGEALPTEQFKKAIKSIENADILIIIGTSLQVYPAAGLVNYFQGEVVYIVDPNPNSLLIAELGAIVIKEVASVGTLKLVEELLN